MLDKTMKNAITDRKIKKGTLGDLVFQLNPTSMTHDGGAVWADIPSPGIKTTVSSYSYGNPEIFTFELWFNNRHAIVCDVPKAYKTLDKYRKAKTQVLFTYGTTVKKVVVQSCSFQIEAWDKKLNVSEFRATVSLKVV